MYQGGIMKLNGQEDIKKATEDLIQEAIKLRDSAGFSDSTQPHKGKIFKKGEIAENAEKYGNNISEFLKSPPQI